MVASVPGIVPVSVPDNGQRKSRGRKPLIANNGFPYRPAEISPADYDLSKPWYITFYAFHADSETIQRHRIAKEDLNAIPDLSERLSFAQQLADRINQRLAEGYHFKPQNQAEIPEYDFWKHSLIDAINEVIKIKKADDIDTDPYVSTRSTIEDFLVYSHLIAAHGNNNYKRYYDEYIKLRFAIDRAKLYGDVKNSFLLRHVNKTFVNRYTEYLKTIRAVTNKTVNERLANMAHIISVLMGLDEKIFKGNAFEGLRTRPTKTKKHASYSDAQMQRIIEELERQGKHHVVLFIRLMFYTLGRPNEILQLKVGHIRLEHRRILFIVENAKTYTEEYVAINDRLYEVIIASGIMEYPEDYYIFSAHRNSVSKRAWVYEPGQRKLKENYFYEHINPVIEKLGFKKINTNYTTYSFKHSGAVSLYLATKDPYIVQMQCRHKSLDQTLTYLRDLGLFIDVPAAFQKWQSSI